MSCFCSHNDSIFGFEMVGSGGEFLSLSSDVINGTTQSILVPVSLHFLQNLLRRCYKLYQIFNYSRNLRFCLSFTMIKITVTPLVCRTCHQAGNSLLIMVLSPFILMIFLVETESQKRRYVILKNLCP